MHFSLLEKLGASVLICAWLLYGVNFLGNALVSVDEHVAQLPGAEKQEGAAQTAAAPAEEPAADLGTLLASADPAAGEKVFGKCKACHAADTAGGNKVGPNLHNVVGRDIASHEGFAYSEALSAKEGTWTYAALDHFIANPKGDATGTKMSFAGLSKPQERADVIAYLRANTENPPPLPEPVAKAEPEPAAAAVPPASDSEGGGEQQAAAPEAAAAPAAAAAGGASVVEMIAAADPAVGEKVFGKCKACHSVEKDGPNKVGPHLWDVVGRARGSVADFSYSAALKGLGGEWTYEALDQYLQNPKTVAPGTKMSFAGLSKPEERAAVIAYLRAHSDSPPPLQ